MWLFGVFADLIGANRKLIEDVQYRVMWDSLERNRNVDTGSWPAEPGAARPVCRRRGPD